MYCTWYNVPVLYLVNSHESTSLNHIFLPSSWKMATFCPVPHTTRDQVWLVVGVAIGVAVTLAVSRKR